MVNDMRYFKFDNGILISAYNQNFAKDIYNQVCINKFDNDDIEEVSKYEALGLFAESLSNNEVDMELFEQDKKTNKKSSKKTTTKTKKVTKKTTNKKTNK